MLGAIDDGSDFNLAADKFRRSFAPDLKLSGTNDGGSEDDAAARPEDEADSLKNASAGDEPAASRGRPGVPNETQSDSSGDAADEAGVPGTSTHDEPSSSAGSFSRSRALAQQKALAEQLRGALKGELVPDDDDAGGDEATSANEDSEEGLGDEEYRDAVLQYERNAGRKPELGGPRQVGWDVRSEDPHTKVVRLIEVKGKGRVWSDDEVVELSRAQVHKAFQSSAGGTEDWYLYVVEKKGNGGYEVLPVPNPVHVAAKWMLCGRSWRMVAEDEVRRDASRQSL